MQELTITSAKKFIKKILSGKIPQESILKAVESNDLSLYKNNLIAIHKAYNKSVMCKQVLEMHFSSDFLLLIVFSMNLLNNINKITNMTQSQPALATTISVMDKGIAVALMNYISFIKNRRLSELGTMRYIVLGYKNLLTKINEKDHTILASTNDKLNDFYKFLNSFQDESLKTYPVHYSALILTIFLSCFSTVFNLKELNDTNSVTSYLGAVFGSMFLVYSFFLTANDLCKKMHKSKKVKSMLNDVRKVIENALIEKQDLRVEEVKDTEHNEEHSHLRDQPRIPINDENPATTPKKNKWTLFNILKSSSVNTRVTVAQEIQN